MVRIAFLSDIVTDIVNFVDTLFQAMARTEIQYSSRDFKPTDNEKEFRKFITTADFVIFTAD